MFKIFSRFIVRLLIVTSVLALASISYFSKNPENYFTFFPVMFVIFMVLPALVFAFLVKQSTDMKKFPNHYMLALTLKFFLLAGVALYYKLAFGDQITSFIISFFVFYISYQVTETVSVLKYIKQNGKINHP